MKGPSGWRRVQRLLDGRQRDVAILQRAVQVLEHDRPRPAALFRTTLVVDLETGSSLGRHG
jgi:hypothetical protein